MLSIDCLNCDSVHTLKTQADRQILADLEPEIFNVH